MFFSEVNSDKLNTFFFKKRYLYFSTIHLNAHWSDLAPLRVDKGHISLYGAIQSLKYGSLPDEDFNTTIDHFNAV